MSDKQDHYRKHRNARLGIPAGYSLHEPFLDFWPSVVLGTSLAGAIWPFALYLLSLFENVGATSLFSLPIGEMLVAGAITLLFGGTVCLLVLALISAAIVLAMNLVLNTLQVDCEHLLVGTFVGGMVGLTMALPFCFVKDPTYWRCTTMITLATLLTQLGGTWGAWRALSVRLGPEDVMRVVPTAFQFGIRQMLMLTVWCAAILTLLKYTGVLNERLLSLIAIWAVVQLLLLAGFALLAKNWLAKHRATHPPTT